MMQSFSDFLYMHGHGVYVWSAYASVFIVLGSQWYLARRQSRHLIHLKKHMHTSAKDGHE